MPEEPRHGPSLLYAVKRLELAIRAQLDDLLADSGVTTLQYTALTVLERNDGMSAAELARRSFVTPQAMSDMTKALEARGLIRRRTNSKNRRAQELFLTASARRLLRRYQPAADELEQRMVAELSATQVRTLRQALQSAWTTLARPPARSSGNRDHGDR